MRPPADVPLARDYLRILVAGWRVILCAVVLSAGSALGAQMLATTQYVASVQLFAVVPGDAEVHAAWEGNRAASGQVPSYAQLAKSQQVLRRTIDDVGLDAGPASLAKSVSVRMGPISPITYLPRSALLGIDVTGKDAQKAVQTANSLAKNLMAVSRELQQTDSGPAGELVLVDGATSAHEKHASILTGLGLGAAIGLVLSSVVLIAVAAVRNTVLSRGQVESLANQMLSRQPSRTQPSRTPQ